MPAALAGSLQSWEGLLERLPIGVYACDRDGALVRYNRRAAELWGHRPASGAPIPASAEEAMAELLATGGPLRDRELMFERSDGTRITVLANLDPLLGPDGEIVGGVAFLEESAAREAAEKVSRERERRFEELLNALPAAVYTTDAEGRITFYNRAAAELWGCRPELGSDRWCGSWRLYRTDGTPLPHDECPMAVALKEGRPVRDAEAIAERPDGIRVPFIPYPTPLRDASGALVGAVNMLVDITERKRAEDTQRLLLAELNHRVKNTLATVQAIARQTLARTKDPVIFVPSFSGRLQALARAHTLLTQSNWRGADLDELIREQLLLDTVEDSRIACSGPKVVLAPEVALHLAMILHELGTNARKHGALAVPRGRLAVRWTVEAAGAGARLLRLRWTEVGGPPVSTSSAPGFGTVLIEQSVKANGGDTRMLCEANGVSWEISLPLSTPATESADFGDARLIRAPRLTAVRTARRRDAGRDDDRVPAGRAGLNGRRVLVVEDEPVLALDIASTLSDAGVAVVGPAGTVAEAARLMETARLDGALVDANLGGHPVDEVAAALTRRNIPFAFVTGYRRESLPLAFRAAALIAKPFNAQELLEAVVQLLSRGEETDDDDVLLPMRGCRATKG